MKGATLILKSALWSMATLKTEIFQLMYSDVCLCVGGFLTFFH